VTDRVVIVGGGVIGTMHAWHAVRRGLHVTQLEREADSRGASVRNFGLVWVGGRRAGAELALALRARELWAEVAADCPGTGFRPVGSLTVATDDRQRDAVEEAVKMADAGERGFELLDGDSARQESAALGPEVIAALACRQDAVVEPRLVPGAVRSRLLASGRYTWLPGCDVVDVDGTGVTDHRGRRHDGDLVVVCTGATHTGPLAGLLTELPLRRVRLQMLETRPFDVAVGPALADIDSLRYYPAYEGAPRDHLAPQDAVGSAWHSQLLLVQRNDGSLTIGDTHAYDEPLAFDYDSVPENYLLAAATRVLGRRPPEVARRWTGVYSQVTDDRIYARATRTDGVVVVTGPGGRGMTLSPAIAEETFT
jgi:FAD dependent oxidoreductase TIGR03364